MKDSQILEKITCTLLVICLILTVILPLNVISSDLISNNNYFVQTSSIPRQNDIDLWGNNFKPNIISNTVLAESYYNDGNSWILFNVTVNDIDEPDWPNIHNGSNIFSVVIDLSDIFNIDYKIAMLYNGTSGLDQRIFNESRLEGFYHHNLTIPEELPPRHYIVNINVTDNGFNDGDFKLSNMTKIIISVSQSNRAPRIRNINQGGINSYIFKEDEYNTSNPLSINLNDTVFYDEDILFGPYNNTPLDFLIFSFYHPTIGWIRFGDGSNAVDFSNFTIQFRNELELLLIPKENAFTAPTGVILLVNATDSHGEWQNQEILINIKPVNDRPVLNPVNEWTMISKNIKVLDDYSIECTQGSIVEMNVTAYDIDNNELKFNIDKFNPNSTALKKLPFAIDLFTGNIKFIPNNDAVGNFNVLINVSDGFELDKKLVTFIIKNFNDPPRIEKVLVNNLAKNIVDKRVNISIKQNEKINITVIAFDPDMIRGLENETLSFSAIDESDVNKNFIFEKLDEMRINLTYKPDNNDVGIHIVNVTVKDIGNKIDYVLLQIIVQNVNDPPKITKCIKDGNEIQIPPDKVLDFKDHPLIKSKSNFTLQIIVSDDDYSVPGGENISWQIKGIPITAYNIKLLNSTRSNMTRTVELQIQGNELNDGDYTINISFEDDDKSFDYLILKLKVNMTGGVTPIINQAPSILLDTENPKIEIGSKLIITGSVIDDDKPVGRKLKVHIQIYNSQDNDFKLFSTLVDVKTDLSYNYEYIIPEKVGNLSTKGSWSIEVWASDGDKNSSVVKTSLTIIEKGSAEKEEPSTITTLLPIFIILIIVIIVIIILLFLVFRRRRSQKDVGVSEEKETRVEGAASEAIEEEELETDFVEEEEEVELEKEPDEIEVDDWEVIDEEDELESELKVEESLGAEPQIEVAPATKAGKSSKEKVPTKFDEDEDIFEDLEIEEPVEEQRPIKGKLPPSKGTLPEKSVTGISKEPKSVKTAVSSPTIIKLETRSEKCGICLGAIKTGLTAIKCSCGKYYHEACGTRVGYCPSCDSEFAFEKAAIKDEGIEDEAPELELPEDMEAYISKPKKSGKERGVKTAKDKSVEIIAGLDERLAKGEISEDTYLMLKKKYEK